MQPYEHESAKSSDDNLFGPESHNRFTNAMANWRRITGILRALLALREEYRAPNIDTHVIEGV
jgi:hypothetical protein